MPPSIKTLIASGDYQEALRGIAAAAVRATDPSERLTLARWLEKLPAAAASTNGFLVKHLAILGGYSTQFLAHAIRLELFQKGIFAVIRETDYGTYESEILRGSPDLVDFRPDVSYFCVGTDHIRHADLAEERARWTSLWRKTRALLTCEILFNTFEEPLHRSMGSFDHKSSSGRTHLVRALNAALGDDATPDVHFVDVNYLAGHHGRKFWRNETLHDVSKMPVSLDHLFDYASEVASVMSAIYGRTRKCLVLDLDNTLWGGVIGDDGVAGIKIGEDSGPGEAFKRLQTYVKALKDRGVVLAVCSKNDETLAKEPFLKRTDMVLRLPDIACFVANWEPKDRNIAAIARTLNLGLDSLAFLDDNPAERDLVRRNLPDVAVVELPEDPALYCSALDQSRLFDIVQITNDDLGRTAKYSQNASRVALEQQFGTYDEFLESLEMRGLVESFDAVNLPRIVQLINKTNQFNLTTRRYSEADVQALVGCPHVVTRYVKLSDKFGDNGLIAVFIAKPRDADTMEIDTWLMSCRVLQRGVERFLFNDVLAELTSRGVRRLIGRYIPTGKNKLVEQLLPSLAFRATAASENGSVEYSLDLTDDRVTEEAMSNAPPIASVTDSEYQLSFDDRTS